MRRNFANSVDIPAGALHTLDPKEYDNVDRVITNVGMVDTQLVTQRTNYFYNKPFMDIDLAKAFQTKVEFATWMDKFQAKETTRIDNKVTNIMQKYCKPHQKDMKSISNSIDLSARTSNEWMT